MITLNNSLFSKYTYSKIHCLYASKKEYVKDICTESINIIYVQLYANCFVKQRHISIISFHIAPAPNNDFHLPKTSCSSSNSFKRGARHTGKSLIHSEALESAQILTELSGVRSRPEEVLSYCL